MVREEVGGSAMITGFPNLGNTCYMNSALHALAVVFPLLFQRQEQQVDTLDDASPRREFDCGDRRLTALLRQVFQLRASTSPMATAEPQASSSSSSSLSSVKKRNSDEHHHRKQKLLE
ncbi:ubiquitin hydrolase, putative, partial [Bodo saltans]